MIRHILFITFACALAVFYLRSFQLRTIFVPYRQVTQTPKDIGLDYKDVTLRTADGQSVTGWFIPKKDAHLTLYFLHGNGGNLSHRLQKIAVFHSLGLNVFIIDYRGYGRSTGAPSEKGLYLDAQAGYDYLTRILKIAPGRIVVNGESLGSAVAIDLASKNKIGGLIAEGGFTSAKDMARGLFPFLPSFMLVVKFDSFSKINRVDAPKLFIHSRNDEIVPYALAARLFEQAPGPKFFLELHGGHNETFFQNQELVKEKLGSFFQNLETSYNEK